ASTQAPFSGIEWRFPNTDIDLVNNLLTHNLMEREGATARLLNNVYNQPLSLFVDGANGDLHLVSTATAAIDQGGAVAPGLVDGDIDGDVRPIGPARDVGADEYGISPPAAVSNLRITSALTGTTTLTATLAWTPPAGAVTASLRYAASAINNTNWSSATVLDDALPGSTSGYVAVVPLPGGTAYFALTTQNAGGTSGVSNNAFWPHRDVFLPLVLREATP
ncbi:MAG: hypothetical protein JW934_08910, partial [Anaerolineae bacterium]|nr:hypothetical protein [Anaerolineae bacterium]